MITNYCNSTTFSWIIGKFTRLRSINVLNTRHDNNNEPIFCLNKFIRFFFLSTCEYRRYYTSYQRMKGSSCAHSRARRTRALYKSRLYRAGPRQHEESPLDVNALGVARNHIRHEQAALPREFTSAGLRFRHGAIVTTNDNERGVRVIDEATDLPNYRSYIYTYKERERGREEGDEVVAETSTLIIISFPIVGRRNFVTRELRSIGRVSKEVIPGYQDTVMPFIISVFNLSASTVKC